MSYIDAYQKKRKLMHIGIFEDQSYINLRPLTWLRPVFDLRSGMFLLREKIEKTLSGLPVRYFVRNELLDFVKQKYPDIPINSEFESDILLLNGRALLPEKFLRSLLHTKQTLLYKIHGEVAAAFIKHADASKLSYHSDGTLNFDHIAEWRPADNGVKLIQYLWELVHQNPEQITSDFNLATKGLNFSHKTMPGVHLLSPEDIWIASSASIDPGVVIDARKGPVYIDNDARVMPQTTIQGPAYVGKSSVLRIGAKIYPGTSIGEVCKIGGEVDKSIFHSYTNKQHDGFIGNAYLGQWVNIGADANNSDLKNNYGPVRVIVNGKEIDTGSTFVGLMMGDHSKAGINAMFNTGTVVGIMCNIFGPNFPPKNIPDFSWGGSDGLVEYEIERAINVAKKVMSRRNVSLSEAEEKLLRDVFATTKKERGQLSS